MSRTYFRAVIVLIAIVLLVYAATALHHSDKNVALAPVANTVRDPDPMPTLPKVTTTTAAPHVAAPKATRSYKRPVANGSLDRIAQCESGGNYTAQNRHSTASGKYQVLDSTWGGYGGYSRAKDAPPDVQEQQAAEMYARSGSSPWNASRGCWG